jgi:hypothetical protein
MSSGDDAFVTTDSMINDIQTETLRNNLFKI